MKKILCIFLLLWLPCFLMAANAMSLKMQWMHAPAMAKPMQSPSMAHNDMMPCHETASSKTTPSTPAPDQPTCSVCGFCVCSISVVSLAEPLFQPLVLRQTAPHYVAFPTLSIALPPAVKPPILV